MARKATIIGQHRRFDGFFKIDELDVGYERADGTTARQTREVFERGDAVAVLLLDREHGCVVLLEQFRVSVLVGRRRGDPATDNGRIIETVAGMIDAADPTPEAAAIRETFEETGYRIARPRLIAKFFSSPGGSSERVFVYFAEVVEADRKGAGGGVEGEDITLVYMPVAELFELLASGAIEDPKLLVGAYWLRDNLA